MTRALNLAVLSLALLGACGGDDDGGGGGAGDALAPVPRQWAAGEGLGYALISRQTKSPTDLTAEACLVDVQLASASASGGLPESASEGTCIVTDSVSWVGLTDPAPACAGVVTFMYAGTNRRITVCGDSFAAPIEVPCAPVAEAPQLQLTSDLGGVEGAVLGSLAASLAAPGVPTVRVPEPQGEGTALWPEGDGDLALEWASQDADGVEIVIGQTSGTGPEVRCLTADDGSFSVPASLLAPYRGGTTFVEVAALEQQRDTPDGFAFRTTFRVSDAIWLFPR